MSLRNKSVSLNVCSMFGIVVVFRDFCREKRNIISNNHANESYCVRERVSKTDWERKIDHVIVVLLLFGDFGEATINRALSLDERLM